MTGPPALLAGVELGGTKCICILGTGDGETREQVRIATGEPEATLRQIEDVLDGWRGFAALGVASFGPVELDRGSQRYGFITSTPKPGWRDTDVAGRLVRRYGVPTSFSSDVNGAALAEGRWGAAQGLNSFAYITVGTGVGVGLVSDGRPVIGFSHSELGHIRIARAPGDDWPGTCPFHGDCVEGLISGPAIEKRLGVPADTVAPDHPIWGLVAHGLGQLLHTLVAATAPRRVLIGGGIMQSHLFPAVRRHLVESLNGYIALPEPPELYVVPPGLGDNAGPLGALALAGDALDA